MILHDEWVGPKADAVKNVLQVCYAARCRLSAQCSPLEGPAPAIPPTKRDAVNLQCRLGATQRNERDRDGSGLLCRRGDDNFGSWCQVLAWGSCPVLLCLHFSRGFRAEAPSEASVMNSTLPGGSLRLTLLHSHRSKNVNRHCATDQLLGCTEARAAKKQSCPEQVWFRASREVHCQISRLYSTQQLAAL